jgi:hypothetical protein
LLSIFSIFAFDSLHFCVRFSPFLLSILSIFAFDSLHFCFRFSQSVLAARRLYLAPWYCTRLHHSPLSCV